MSCGGTPTLQGPELQLVQGWSLGTLARLSAVEKLTRADQPPRPAHSQMMMSNAKPRRNLAAEEEISLCSRCLHPPESVEYS